VGIEATRISGGGAKKKIKVEIVLNGGGEEKKLIPM